MFSAGPMFVTMQWAFYKHPEQLTILPVELYGKYKVGALNVPGCQPPSHEDAATAALLGSSHHEAAVLFGPAHKGHTHAYTYVHTRIHTYMHARTHTHTPPRRADHLGRDVPAPARLQLARL